MLRLKKDVSEYQMSLDLGKNKSYIQGISSGRSMPSMKQFFEICDYLEITPLEFFDTEMAEPPQFRRAVELLKELDNEDWEAIIPLLMRLRKEITQKRWGFDPCGSFQMNPQRAIRPVSCGYSVFKTLPSSGHMRMLRLIS